jgi:hypothetical protein
MTSISSSSESVLILIQSALINREQNTPIKINSES